MKQHSCITPRLIRFRDAPRYLGMDRNRFNAKVRSHPVEIRLGRQGIACDQLELDAWAGQTISRNGCEARTIIPPSQWAKLVEIVIRDDIPRHLKMPRSAKLQGID